MDSSLNIFITFKNSVPSIILTIKGANRNDRIEIPPANNIT